MACRTCLALALLHSLGVKLLAHVILVVLMSVPAVAQVAPPPAKSDRDAVQHGAQPNSGEVRPGVRSPEVWTMTPTTEKTGFGWANYATVALYLAAMVWLGMSFGSRNHAARAGSSSMRTRRSPHPAGRVATCGEIGSR